MATRCKMKCTQVGEHDAGPGKKTYSVKMYPVTGDSEENKKFFAYTPTGGLELATMNNRHFEVGKQYYVDITEAE